MSVRPHGAVLGTLELLARADSGMPSSMVIELPLTMIVEVYVAALPAAGFFKTLARGRFAVLAFPVAGLALPAADFLALGRFAMLALPAAGLAFPAAGFFMTAPEGRFCARGFCVFGPWPSTGACPAAWMTTRLRVSGIASDKWDEL